MESLNFEEISRKLCTHQDFRSECMHQISVTDEWRE